MLAKKNCEFCQKEFQPVKSIRRFCSKECSGKGARNPNQKTTKGQFRRELVILQCQFCKKDFTVWACKHKYRPYTYCSNKCSLKANRSRSRSKAEISIYDFLVTTFPNVTIISNDRTTFEGLEIDIWIPELKLAIELNGPYHYKPILGTERLYQTQENDKKKMKLANRLDINLIVIPLNNCRPKELDGIKTHLVQLVQELITLQEKLHAQSGIHGNA